MADVETTISFLNFGGENQTNSETDLGGNENALKSPR